MEQQVTQIPTFVQYGVVGLCALLIILIYFLSAMFNKTLTSVTNMLLAFTEAIKGLEKVIDERIPKRR